VPAVHARGYDDLAPETLARLESSHVASLEPGDLRNALAVTVLALVREAGDAGLVHVEKVAERLAGLR
jgi:hypothetical protein